MREGKRELIWLLDALVAVLGYAICSIFSAVHLLVTRRNSFLDQCLAGLGFRVTGLMLIGFRVYC